MQAFIVYHKPTKKFLTSGWRCARKSQVLRATKGELFMSKDAAKGAVENACARRLRSSYPEVLHGGKRSDFTIKEFPIVLEALLEGRK